MPRAEGGVEEEAKAGKARELASGGAKSGVTFEGRESRGLPYKGAKKQGEQCSAQACQTGTWQKRSRDRRSIGKTARGERGMVPAQTHAEKRAGRHQGAGTGKMLAEEARRSVSQKRSPQASLQRCSRKAHGGCNEKAQMVAQSAPFRLAAGRQRHPRWRPCWPLRKAGRARCESGTSRGGRLTDCPARQQREFLAS